MIKKTSFILLILLGLLGFVSLAQADVPSLVLPAQSVINADGSRVYFPDQLNNRILVVNGTTGYQVAGSPITLGGTPRGLALSPDGTKLYVTVTTASSLKIKAYYTASNTFYKEYVVESSPVAGSSLNGLAMSPDGNYLYTVEEITGKIYIIYKDLNDKRTVTAPAAGLYGVAIKPDGTRLYVSNRLAGKVYVYDIQSGAVPSSTPVATLSSCPNATYMVVADVSVQNANGVYEPKTYLFVKINQTVTPYYDVKAYDTATYTNKFYISAYMDYKDATGNAYSGKPPMPTHGADPNNPFDGMAVSPNGAFLYFTHWNKDFVDIGDDPVTGTHKLFVYAYSINECNKGSTNLDAKTWIVHNIYTNSKDSIVLRPDARGMWRNFSNGADYYYEGWPDTVALNFGYDNEALPSAPKFVSPLADQTVTNVNIDWTAATDADTTGPLTYILEGITADAASTNLWWPITSTTETQLNATTWLKFQYNKSYYLRVRAYDGTDTNPSQPGAFSQGNFGAYGYTGPFTRGVGAPTGLTVSPTWIKMTTASASWDATDPWVDSYTVSWGTDSNASNISTETIAARNEITLPNGFKMWVPDTDLQLTNLQPNTKHYVKVRNNIGGVSSDYSSAVSFNTSSTPDAPQGVTVEGISMTGATVSWWKVDGSTNYEVKLQKSIGTKGGWTDITPFVTTQEPYTWVALKGLEPLTDYRVAVRAFYNQNAGSYSTYVPFSTTDKLTTPEGIEVKDIKMTSAILSWWEVGGAKGYKIQYAASAVPLDDSLVPSGHVKELFVYTGQTWAKMIDLAPGDSYHARVRAFIPVGHGNLFPQDGPWGYSGNFITSTVLEKPTGVTVYNIGATTAQVSWEVTDGATGYTVRYGKAIIDPITGQPWYDPITGEIKKNWLGITTAEGGNKTWISIPPVGGGDLYPNNKYYVEVKAERTLNPAQSSGYAKATPYPFTTLTSSQVPKGVVVYNVGYNSAWVSWEGVADVAANVGAKYQVEILKVLGPENYLVVLDDFSGETTVEGQSITWHKVSGLAPNTPYIARVKSYLSSNYQSDWSNPSAQFTTLANLPAPKGFTIYDQGLISVWSSWEAVEGANAYELTLRRVDGSWVYPPSNPLVTAETWRKIPGLVPQTDYIAALRATNAAGHNSNYTEIGFNTLSAPPPVKEKSIIAYNIAMTHGQVSWEAVEGVTKYEVYYVKNSAVQPNADYIINTQPKVETTETWASLHGLNYFESPVGYWMYVRAFGNGYWGPLSPNFNQSQHRMIMAQKPWAPENLTFDEQTITDKTATTSWYDEEDATAGFTVALTTDPAANPNNGLAGFTTYTTAETWQYVTGLTPQTNYYVWVRSRNYYQPSDKTTLGDFVGPMFMQTQLSTVTTINLKVLLQGYYDAAAGTNKAAAINVELRNPANTVVTTVTNVPVGENGIAAVNVEGAQDGGYYLAVKQVIANAPAGANHLPVITKEQVQLVAGQDLNVNLADAADASFLITYKPTDSDPDALYTDGAFLVMRAGDADGNGLVNILDFGEWASVNGATTQDGTWKPAADFNGDGLINILDFGLWGQNNGQISYVVSE